jgi:hypothetical protein
MVITPSHFTPRGKSNTNPMNGRKGKSQSRSEHGDEEGGGRLSVVKLRFYLILIKICRIYATMLKHILQTVTKQARDRRLKKLLRGTLPKIL